MPKFHLVLLIHAHQPVGNFDAVFEDVYQKSYLPFVEQLDQHPAVRVGLHYSGCLLEWLESRHPEYMEKLRELVARRQVEMVGGGYYEPILVSIPPADQTEQLRRLSDYLARQFGQAPTGAWLTERVWEPQLPSALASADLLYTLVDDVHFQAAGFDLDQLHGVYIAEDGGHPVRVLPSLKALRYLLPFQPPEEAVAFLRQRAAKQPGGMAAMGDDLEKFGAWPGTYDHCYRHGWLEKFFVSLEGASSWLATTPPGEYVAAHAPLGRADLPTASYPEMMEWVLPTASRKQFHALSEEFASRPEVLRFLRGGQWRGFFSKYPESNLLQKKMLRASERVRSLQKRPGRAKGARAKLAQAREHILRAQCNDAFWHGVFGGLYAPHLRTELWRDLVRAETLADEAAYPKNSAVRIERADFDADGTEEVVVSSPRLSALVRPAAGGTIEALDFRPSAMTLINSLQRRPEAYHDRLRETGHKGNGKVASIHDNARSREEGLERFLQYDRWPRNSFRLLLFSPAKTHDDYAAVGLEEHAGLAGGDYAVRAVGENHVDLTCETSMEGRNGAAVPMCCLKRLSFAHDEGNGFTVSCAVELSVGGGQAVRAMVGLEMIVNLLAPTEPDRYFEVQGQRHPLRWAAAVPAAPPAALRVVDEWQNVAATIEAPSAAQFWIVPIETVSESELGFERVYQGSQILALWPVEVAAGAGWRGEAILRVLQAHAAAEK